MDQQTEIKYEYKQAFMGIDPGQSGGIVVFYDTIQAPGAIKMPDTVSGIKEVFDRLKETTEHVTCYIEKQWPRPTYRVDKITKEVVIIQGSASQGKLMYHYGTLVGLLYGCGIQFEEHPPQNWMKFYALKKNKGEAQGAWKNRLKDMAIRYYPKAHVTLKTADAMLIAHYCRESKAWHKARKIKSSFNN